MLNIKEIALQLAHRKCTRYAHVPVDRGIRYNFSDAHLIDFAEALITELAKGNESVASVVPCHTPSGKRVALNTGYQHLPVGTKLYTLPPTAEQIANETAEAIAKMLEGGSFLSTESKVALAANGAAKAIRSGVWKEFKQS